MRIISALLASVLGQSTTPWPEETSAAPTDGPTPPDGPEGYCDAERCDLHSDLIFELQNQMNELKAENEALRDDVTYLQGWGVIHNL